MYIHTLESYINILRSRDYAINVFFLTTTQTEIKGMKINKMKRDMRI